MVYLAQSGMQLKATGLLKQFFAFFGVTGVHLPAVAIVGALLGIHIDRRRRKHEDPWAPEPKLYAFMFLESAFLSIPLFVLMSVLFRQPPAAATDGLASLAGLFRSETDWSAWRLSMVIALGAGLYEELVFRLIAIALITLIADELLALPKEVCVGLGVGLSSLGFALIHFGGGAPFDVTRFIFYLVTGVYFAAIYLSRGFGIVVAVHALYDALVFTKAVIQSG
ncbi:MAG: CPBP family intramembrane glutamic endopeptidase [Planctomycetota bacterium]